MTPARRFDNGGSSQFTVLLVICELVATTRDMRRYHTNPLLRSGKQVASNVNDPGFKVPGVVRGHWQDLPPLQDITDEQAEEVAQTILETEQEMLEDINEVIAPEPPTVAQVIKADKDLTKEVEQLIQLSALKSHNPQEDIGNVSYKGAENKSVPPLIKTMTEMFELTKLLLEIGRTELSHVLEQKLVLDDPMLLDPLLQYSEDFHAAFRTFMNTYWSFTKAKNPYNTQDTAFVHWYQIQLQSLDAVKDNCLLKMCSLINYLGEIYPQEKEREAYAWTQANVCAKLQGRYDTTTVEEIKKSDENFLSRQWNTLKSYFKQVNEAGRNVYELYVKLKDKWYIRSLLWIWKHRVILLFVGYFGLGVYWGAAEYLNIANYFSINGKETIPVIEWIRILADALCQAANAPLVRWTTAGYLAEIALGAIMRYTGLNVLVGEKIGRIMGTFANATTKFLVPVIFHRIVKESVLWMITTMCTVESAFARFGSGVIRAFEVAANWQYDAIVKFKNIAVSIIKNPTQFIGTYYRGAFGFFEDTVNAMGDVWKHLRVTAVLLTKLLPTGFSDFVQCSLSSQCLVAKMGSVFDQGYDIVEGVFSSGAENLKSFGQWIGLLDEDVPVDPTFYTFFVYLGLKQSDINRMKTTMSIAYDLLASNLSMIDSYARPFLLQILKSMTDSWLIQKVGDFWSYLWESLYLIWNVVNWGKEVFFAFNVHYELWEWTSFEEEFSRELLTDTDLKSRLGGLDMVDRIKKKKEDIIKRLARAKGSLFFHSLAFCFIHFTEVNMAEEIKYPDVQKLREEIEEATKIAQAADLDARIEAAEAAEEHLETHPKEILRRQEIVASLPAPVRAEIGDDYQQLGVSPSQFDQFILAIKARYERRQRVQEVKEDQGPLGNEEEFRKEALERQQPPPSAPPLLPSERRKVTGQRYRPKVPRGYNFQDFEISDFTSGDVETPPDEIGQPPSRRPPKVPPPRFPPNRPPPLPARRGVSVGAGFLNADAETQALIEGDVETPPADIGVHPPDDLPPVYQGNEPTLLYTDLGPPPPYELPPSRPPPHLPPNKPLPALPQRTGQVELAIERLKRKSRARRRDDPTPEETDLGIGQLFNEPTMLYQAQSYVAGDEYADEAEDIMQGYESLERDLPQSEAERDAAVKIIQREMQRGNVSDWPDQMVRQILIDLRTTRNIGGAPSSKVLPSRNLYF